jgi:hypothetical protein
MLPRELEDVGQALLAETLKVVGARPRLVCSCPGRARNIESTCSRLSTAQSPGKRSNVSWLMRIPLYSKAMASACPSWRPIARYFSRMRMTRSTEAIASKGSRDTEAVEPSR